MNENCRLRVMTNFSNAQIPNCTALNGRVEKFAEALGADGSVNNATLHTDRQILGE